MTVKERIKRFIEFKGITTYAFEKECGFSKGFVKNIVSTIGVDKLERILSAYPDLNANWLIRGVGEMTIDQSNVHEMAMEAAKYLKGEKSGFPQFFAPVLTDSRRTLTASGHGLNISESTLELPPSGTITEQVEKKIVESEEKNSEETIKSLNSTIELLQSTIKSKDETIETLRALVAEKERLISYLEKK